MMNSAGARILLVSVFVFLGGFVRAELTAPSHRFFGTHSQAALGEDNVRECLSAEAAAPGLELAPVLQEIIAVSDASVASIGEPAAHARVDVVEAADPYAWLAAMGSAPAAPSLVCDGTAAEADELLTPDFASALTLASVESAR